MTESAEKFPDLEARFLPPEGWRWHTFTYKGRQMRFGTVSPKDSVPDGVVVCLQGLSEFGEKYFETAHDLLKRNMSVWVLDWQGQGKSDRYFKKQSDSQRRHAVNFSSDVEDLAHFINEYVKPAAVHPDVGRLPLVMLSHSMGGNIGMRYLHRYPDVFACAAFSAPMLSIKALEAIPRWLRVGLTAIFRLVAGGTYVFGGKDWVADTRIKQELNIFSDDPRRAAVHNTWCLFDRDLQVGNVTFGWLHAAASSCAFLQKPNVMKAIKTPSYVALAEHEDLLSNAPISEAVKHMPNVTLVELKDSKHEILMERDFIRNQWFAGFDELLKKVDIKNKREPF